MRQRGTQGLSFHWCPSLAHSGLCHIRRLVLRQSMIRPSRQPRFTALGVFAAAIAALSCASALGQYKKNPVITEPHVDYVFPIGGRQGDQFEVQVEGRLLEGASAVWTDSTTIRAQVQSEEAIEIWIRGIYAGNSRMADDTVQRGQRVLLQVQFDEAAPVGMHALRLVTPRGLSTPIQLRVSDRSEPVVLEDEARSCCPDPDRAQLLDVPSLVNGRTAADMQGEVDYYAIDVGQGDELEFEAFYDTRPGSAVADQAGKIAYILELYEPLSSWFDDRKLRRIAMNDAPISYRDTVRPVLRNQFEKGGRYLLAVKAFDGTGGPEYSYQLRIAPVSAAPTTARIADGARLAWPVAADPDVRWLDSSLTSFSKQLSAERLQRLASRTGLPEAGTDPPGDNDAPPQELMQVDVTAINGDDTSAAPIPISVPVLIEGVVASPGQVGLFRFRPPVGQGLYFEIDTPESGPPRFHPWFTVEDEQGEVVFTNVAGLVTGNNVMLVNTLQSTQTHSFDTDGEYLLKIRDLTSRHGGADFRYRMVIRPSIPHLGPISLSTDRVNLARGSEIKVSVAIPKREGLQAEFTVACGDIMPTGVTATIEGTNLTLVADADAPLGEMPHVVRVVAHRVLDGDGGPGPPLPAGELLLIVVDPQELPELVISSHEHQVVKSTEQDIVPGQCPIPLSAQPAAELAESGDEGSAAGVRAVAVNDGDSSPIAPSPGDDTQDAELSIAELVALELHPPQATLTGAATSQRFLVLGTLADGRRLDVTSQSTLSVSDPAIVQLNSQQRAVGIADGATVLRAELQGHSAESSLLIERAAEPRPFHFARDIERIFTRNGCNAAACHGGVKGRGGVKLSLNATRPEQDYQWIVRGGVYQVLTDEVGEPVTPRIHVDDPTMSLLLLKPTDVEPHEGGERFGVDSDAYARLRDWIGAGAKYGEHEHDSTARIEQLEIFPAAAAMAPGETHGLLVTAHLAGGLVEDYTDEVRYESGDASVAEVSPDGSVRAVGPGETTILARAAGLLGTMRLAVVAPASQPLPVNDLARRNLIDEHVFDKLALIGVTPAQIASDAEFLRRVCLDLTGTLPPPNRIREFLASEAPDKRDEVIEQLIDSPEFIDYWTWRFSDLFRVESEIPTESHLYWEWIRESVASRKPFDQIARERLAAQGRDRPAMHYGEDNSSPARLVSEQLQVFMGRRFDCVQCHDHPYEKWSQDQFWGIAACFGRMNFVGYFEVVYDDQRGGYGDQGRGGVVMNPRTKVAVQPAFLDGTILTESQGSDPRRHLADWLTDHDFFAEATVNRVWSYFFHRGIVDPVDDFRTDNQPTHPELLTALAEDFSGHGYDLRRLFRMIVGSSTYQLSSRPADPGTADPGRADELNYSRAIPRPLDAEVLLDAVSAAAGVPELFPNGIFGRPGQAPLGTRAIQLKEASRWPNRFLEVYGRPTRKSVPERDAGPRLTQALHMLAGRPYTAKLSQAGGRIDQLLAGGANNDQIVEELFLATLSRLPTRPEVAALQPLMAARESRREALEDLLWSLVCSREFTHNH